MGCGQDHRGQLCSRANWPGALRISTQRIENHTGLGIPAIFERLGEPAFRQIESEELDAVLGRAAESREPLVLALGGGTYAQPGIVERLRAAGAVVVWLDCPVEICWPAAPP